MTNAYSRHLQLRMDTSSDRRMHPTPVTDVRKSVYWLSCVVPTILANENYHSSIHWATHLCSLWTASVGALPCFWTCRSPIHCQSGWSGLHLYTVRIVLTDTSLRRYRSCTRWHKLCLCPYLLWKFAKECLLSPRLCLYGMFSLMSDLLFLACRSQRPTLSSWFGLIIIAVRSPISPLNHGNA